MAKITHSARIRVGYKILINSTLYTVVEINDFNTLIPGELHTYTLEHETTKDIFHYHLNTLVENQADIVDYPPMN